MACLEPEFPAHSGHVELNGTPVDGVFRLRHVCTLPEFQGKGIAQRVLEKMLDDVVKTRLHATKVVLSTSSPQQAAVRLYEKLGFKCISADKRIAFSMYKQDFELNIV